MDLKDLLQFRLIASQFKVDYYGSNDRYNCQNDLQVQLILAFYNCYCEEDASKHKKYGFKKDCWSLSDP